MWILDFLPSWIFTLITVGGLCAFLATEFLSNLPLISMYLKGIRIGSIVALVIGLYMMGGAANQEKWEARVKELEAKVAISEEQSKTANAQLDAKLKEKAKVIKEKEYIIQEKITKIKDQIDAECKVPQAAVDLLNEAAEVRK
jgi:hypothetical protein